VHNKTTGAMLFLLMVSFLFLTSNTGRFQASGVIYFQSKQSTWLATASTNMEGADACSSSGVINLSAFLTGDLNRDETVDMDDIAAVLAAVFTVPSSPRWNPAADVNNDGTVDFRDVASVAKHLGEHVNHSNILIRIQGPFLCDGQETNSTSCLVTPQEHIEFVAEVTNNSMPLSQTSVSFEVFDNKMASYLRVSSVTDENGTARVDFRMPWPSQNPEILLGVWHATATIQLEDKVLTDTIGYYYDHMLHVWNIATDQHHYNHGGLVQITIDYGSISQQMYPAFFEVSIVDELGITVANAGFSTDVGGASCGEYSNWTQPMTLDLPKWACAGVATIHVNVFDGIPPNVGMPVLLEYAGPMIIIDPH
jgi:hypothetical protein